MSNILSLARQALCISDDLYLSTDVGEGHPERYDDLRPGDVIWMLWVQRYQHGARMRMIKRNRVTLVFEEIEGSYGQGMKWTIHPRTRHAILLCSRSNPPERVDELRRLWRR